MEEPPFKVSQQKVELHPDVRLELVESVTILLHPPTHDKGMVARSSQQLLAPVTLAADEPSGILMLKQHFARLTPTASLGERRFNRCFCKPSKFSEP